MPEHPHKLPGFVIREPDDAGDVKVLHGIRETGWHVMAIPDDEEGPGFAFTIGMYLRTLQPEILTMGLPMDKGHGVLNRIAEYLMAGGTLEPGKRYWQLIKGIELQFRPIHITQYGEYLGYANWFYRALKRPYPALQCFWPDAKGRFPDEDGFDKRYEGMQIDLSLPRK